MEGGGWSFPFGSTKLISFRFVPILILCMDPGLDPLLRPLLDFHYGFAPAAAADPIRFGASAAPVRSGERRVPSATQYTEDDLEESTCVKFVLKSSIETKKPDDEGVVLMAPLNSLDGKTAVEPRDVRRTIEVVSHVCVKTVVKRQRTRECTPDELNAKLEAAGGF